MKIYLLPVVLSLALAFPSALFAQEKVGDATLEYEISVSGKGKEIPKGLSGAAMHIYLKPAESRSEFVSASGTETTIFLSKTGKGVILKEYSGQKLMITLSRENWERKNQVYRNIAFNIEESNETVAGYAVKKAVGTLPGGKAFSVYFTPSVRLQNLEYNYAFPQLNGLPVKFEVESGEITFTYTLKKISTEPVAASRFTIPQTGYRVMTYDENLQLKKGSKK